MNKYVKEWIKVLPKYKQGRGYLRNNGHYCCLGVACEVLVKEKKLTRHRSGYSTVDKKTCTNSLLPTAAQKLLGLQSNSGSFKINKTILKFLKEAEVPMIDNSYLGRETSLAQCNDEFDMTFEQIQALIKLNPPGLFKKKRKIAR